MTHGQMREWPWAVFSKGHGQYVRKAMVSTDRISHPDRPQFYVQIDLNLTLGKPKNVVKPYCRNLRGTSINDTLEYVHTAVG